ncbi:MAG: hypothetical protein WBN75_04085 [Verrucomicrobiia bacterium]|jgi:hypothetical protein
MNRHVNSSKSAMAAWLSTALVTVLPVAAAPVAQPVAPEAVARSVFVIPTNPKEGRDPFFPASTRLYEDAAIKNPVSDLTSLVLKGISGSPDHRLAIINNHTFGVGDEGDVVTPHSRIHVRCIEIKDKSVVIESNGQRHELSYANSP